VGIILWMVSMQLGFVYLSRELKSWSTSARDGPPAGATMERILVYLDAEQRRTSRSSLVVLLLYVAFSIPQLWTYQAVALVFFCGISALSRPAVAILKTKSISFNGGDKASADIAPSNTLQSPTPSITVGVL